MRPKAPSAPRQKNEWGPYALSQGVCVTQAIWTHFNINTTERECGPIACLVRDASDPVWSPRCQLCMDEMTENKMFPNPEIKPYVYEIDEQETFHDLLPDALRERPSN